jgi:predicted permease
MQTAVSWIVSILVAKAFRFNRRASNFVTAMGVFGNSNSLPISLVLSLSQTIKGLHWDRIPGDNDEEVGARGILYLLIFQQLGQLVRWSWGYHVLLASKDKYPEYQQEIAEEGQRHQEDAQDEHEVRPLIEGLDGDTEDDGDSASTDSRRYEPAGRTPVGFASRASLVDMTDEDDSSHAKKKNVAAGSQAPSTLNGNGTDILSFPRIRNEEEIEQPQTGLKGFWGRSKTATGKRCNAWKESAAKSCTAFYERLPKPLQSVLSFFKIASDKARNFIWEFMNPPLWAMLIAVLVASVPALQKLFFQEETFIKNSVTSAIQSSGGVAVPLILVVLGANLARNTSGQGEESYDPEEEKMGSKLLIASLISRMVLPTLIMAPILAVTAKFVPISILDDPIFIIVCFLLSGAPSALQLAQICQLNNVYEKTMGRLLFQSYVVWILPSTLILVMLALETVEWAK